LANDVLCKHNQVIRTMQHAHDYLRLVTAYSAGRLESEVDRNVHHTACNTHQAARRLVLGTEDVEAG
jgi:hypothetical protein